MSESQAISGASNTPIIAPDTIPNPINKVNAREAASITRLNEPLDEQNWSIWRERIRRVFKVCGVLPYVDGTLSSPNKQTHPDNFEAWEFNDSYAQCLISNNITANQMMNVSCLVTA